VRAVADEQKPDPSKWPPLLQFLWALLGNLPRLLALILLLIVLSGAFKGSLDAFLYSMEQHLPAWQRLLGVAAGIGGAVGSSVGPPIYRKWRRPPDKESLPRERPPPNSITQAAGQQHDDALREPTGGDGDNTGDSDPGTNPR
jgi:hypothetical protein